MPNRNVHEVMGHLGRDPELRYISTSRAVCRFSGYQPDRRFKRSYYNKSDNVILAVKGLLDELIEDGVIPVATTQEWRA